MTPIEFKCRREALGMNQPEMAKALGVRQATISRYESGEQGIKPFVWECLADLEEQLEAILEVTAEVLDATADRPVELRVWPDDESFWAANPDYKPLPAVLYRVAMARARMEADDPNTTFLVGP